MCSIGWIKTTTGFILFKNRDATRRAIGTSRVLITEDFLAGGYRNRNGIWIGVNKYSVGFVSALGPYRPSKRDWTSVNKIGRDVLASSKDLDEALDKFLHSFYTKGLNTSANVILADKNLAYLLELLPDKYQVEPCQDRCLATNHFRYLTDANGGFKYLDISVHRLELLEKLLGNEPSIRDVGAVLSMEGICRQGNVQTVSSLVINHFPKATVALYAPGPPRSVTFAEILWKPKSSYGGV